MIHMIEGDIKLLDSEVVARIALQRMGDPVAQKFISDLNAAIGYRAEKYEEEFLRPMRRYYDNFEDFQGLDEIIIECAWDYSNNDSGLTNQEISSAILDYCVIGSVLRNKVLDLKPDELSTLRYSLGIVLKVAGFSQVSSTRRDFGDRKRHWRRGPGHKGLDLEEVLEKFREKRECYIRR